MVATVRAAPTPTGAAVRAAPTPARAAVRSSETAPHKTTQAGAEGQPSAPALH